MNSLTQMKRIEQRKDETVREMLIRENILENTVFLFHGHPPLEGEIR